MTCIHSAARTRRGAMLTALTGVLLTACLLPAARADIVTEWNAKADAIGLEKRVPAPAHLRGLALLHVAVFEAVNSVDRRYAPYGLALSADRSASKEAAAAAAAHAVLVGLYPDKKEDLDAFLAASLATGAGRNPVPAGEARDKGLALGQRAATELMALRPHDTVNARESYRPHTTPGRYVPTVIPAFTSGGEARPWVMSRGSQFRPPAPPALDSETWTRDLNEIRELGARNSTKRSAEQTEIGRFWLFTGAYTFNPIVRQIAVSKKFDLVDSARMFALVAMAGADAGTAVFDAKYAYNLWRPVTAIRNADQTGNPATPRDATWLPIDDTPMHPEYPCAHCISSSAVSAVLQGLVGNDVAEVSITSPTAPGVVRKWTRLQDYSDEVSLARIYAGFHYRFSTEVGKDMGRRIGELTLATKLRGAEAAAQPRR